MSGPSFNALGFSQVTDAGLSRPSQSFFNTWLYRHDHAAQDGAQLYLALPFGIPRWRLSMLAWPLAHADVVQDLAVGDLPGLAQAVQHFFAAHGGEGARIPGAASQRPHGFPKGSTR
ncbi:hypothetical protein EJV47_25690 [Hymenobacter gummosus]|uniref:Uncharacterized protein n=1 Tax=Hymenobacter gummosus TaxID=1776032 RepID=A0A431TVB6_9BACT|nr:hypothetical protein [Hymenobacter gummosus]RTQ45274.1 hypothetical protein EJV47_25690 [Hymenobacter gummosus]